MKRSTCAWGIAVLCLFHGADPTAAAAQAVDDVEIELEEERPSAEEPELRLYRTTRELRELAHIPLGYNVYFGLQMAFLATYEEQGQTDSSDLALDGVELAFDAMPTDQVEGHLLLSFEEDEDEGFGEGTVAVDEAFVRLGGIDEQPFYVELGRMELPFGEFESYFNEGPLVEVIGETRSDAATFGYENEWFEVGASAFTSNMEGEDDIDELLAFLKLDLLEWAEVGVSWTSDLGESDELHDTIRDALREAELEATAESDEEDEDEEPALPSSPLRVNEVDGLGVFLVLEFERYLATFEYITALDSFHAGLLDDRKRDPYAWNSEVAWRPMEHWQLGLRVEQADDLPEEPERQYGVSSLYALSLNLMLSAEYLRGEFADGLPDRDLVTLQVTLIF